MTELDLSLLTDEERAIVARYEQEPNLNSHQEYLAARRNINLLANALIAARAENKRKDDVIAELIDAAEQGRNLLRQMAEVSSLAGRRGAHERADAIDAVLKEATTLLQSEKGVEMPNVTDEHIWESQERFDLAAWLQANRDWSERVFGGGTRAEGVLKHIVKEIEEVRANPSDLEEWVDIVFLAFDGMWRQGYSPEEIVAMMRAKQAKNFARKWPAPPPQDEPSFHVEGGE